jgi:hypothetical protein
VSFETVTNPIRQINGKMQAHNLPGLGIEPIEAVFKEAVAIFD